MDEEVAKVDTWVEGHQIHRGKEKAVYGLGSRQANQTDCGGRARKQAGRRNPTKEPAE